MRRVKYLLRIAPYMKYLPLVAALALALFNRDFQIIQNRDFLISQ